jgi:hypothetical protein
MKRFLTFLTASCLTVAALAQAEDSLPTPSWYIKGLGGFNFSQTALVNWSAGGDNNVAANIYLNAQAGYAKGAWAWDNTLNTQFGMMYTTHNGWNKSVDNFQLSSKLGYTRNNKLYYSLLADFTTQYAKGYKAVGDVNYLSNLMSPGYLNIALGIDYKPSKIISLFYSPATSRFTFVEDDSLSQAGAFGVDPGKHLKTQFGMYAKISLDWKLSESIQVISGLDLFTAYDNTFGNVVVDWNTLINMKITKYLTTTLNFALKYDDHVKTVDKQGNPAGAKIQFKEILGLGLSYSF